MIRGLVAIVGRPNVGKSTIFNRLTRARAAIVDDQPGVTRDRLYGLARLDKDGPVGFTVIDTGGFETEDFNFQPFAENIVWQQTSAAIDQADLVLLVLDAQAGVHPHDEALVRDLEKRGKPYRVVVNKIDGPEHAAKAFEFYELGLGELTNISAAHSRGIADLRDELHQQVCELTADKGARAPDDDAIRLAIVGRPNAGKSSLLNRLAGEERALVSDVAGTTRDRIDAHLKAHGQEFIVVDTAGIRRKTKIKERLESLSVMQALHSIDQADVVILVIDATGGLADQDSRLVNYAVSRHKPIIIAVNKWDIFPNKETNTARDYERNLHLHLKTLGQVPVRFVSCLTNRRLHDLLPLAKELHDETNRRIDTAQVNELIHRAVHEHTPALINNHTKRIKFYYTTQVAKKPPTFVIFCNVATEIQESYKRYLTNRIRDGLGFKHVPVKLIFRDKASARKRDRQEAGEALASQQ